jgi:tRNA (guanosine-2'-O-)-methyltransferase
VVADFAEDAWTPDSVPLDQPLAVLFGSELTGVSDTARSVADGTLLVPMRGLTASLNVSVAAACILQRVTERRRSTLNGPGDLESHRMEGFRKSWVDREELSDRGMAARVGEGPTG